MEQDKLRRAVNENAQQISLKEEIAQLRRELDHVSDQVDVYQALLRSHLTHELIEEQELSVLYKAQKQGKKSNRLAQKRRGKRYVEPLGLKTQKQPSVAPELSEDDSKERKRLYREAMLHVHPDTFSMRDDGNDLATELTIRLVEIYKQEDLATLRAYHAHLFCQTALAAKDSQLFSKTELTTSPDAYLITEKEQLENALKTLKSRHVYHVLTTYNDPSTFIEELRAYYQDRINKLRRRTRTKD